VALPIFDVIWGDRRHPVIDIKISGVNGELLELRQEDDSYSRRPADLIRNLNKLLAIPDEEFLKYTPEQRSNLVSEFAAVHYPPITNHQNVQTGALPIKASKGRP
jgi:hypothetical protein